MTIDTTLLFHPLTFVSDDADIIIGRGDINSYAAFPPDGAALLRQLQAGSSPDEAGQWYQRHYGEAVDMADFLETLYALQFVRVNGEPEIPATRTEPARFCQWLGRAVFSPLAWIAYSILFGLTLFLLVRFPYLRPDYNALFFSPYFILAEAGLILGQFPGILFHESFHVMAGWRQGTSSRLSIGYRLYMLVFETRLDGLWRVERKFRYLPFLAGMLGDLIWFSLMTILAFLTYTPANPYAFPGAFFLALAVSTLLRFSWQFYFYLQTDIYYVLVNAFRCVDLQQTTRQYLWNRIYRLCRQPEKMQDEEQWHPRDRQVARWYVFCFGAGYLFTLGTLLLVGIPTIAHLFSEVVTLLLTHAALNINFWDACLALVLDTLPLVIVSMLALRAYRARKREREATRGSTTLSPDI